MQRRLFFNLAALVALLLLINISAIISPAQRQNKSPSPALPQEKGEYLPDTPANRALHQAILQGDIRAVKAALDAGGSPEACCQSDFGKKPDFPILFLVTYKIIEAPKWEEARLRYVPIFRLLIEHTHNVNIELFNHRSVLMAAVELGDLESVKSLVERGADVNAQTVKMPSSYGRAPIGEENVFYQAVGNNGTRGPDPDPIVLYLLEKGVDINHVCADGSTPLMRAAICLKIKTIRLLLQRGADPAKRDAHGFTALYWATMRGDDDIVALLSPLTPMDLWEAAQYGKVARVKELLAEGADPNAFRVTEYQTMTSEVRKGAVGETPLMAAAKSNDVATVQVLLDAGADAKKIQKRNGNTALYAAAAYGSTAVIPLLLKAGADINAEIIRRDEKGEPEVEEWRKTPLIAAVQANQANTVALLLKSGVQMAAHHQGDTALLLNLTYAGREPRRLRGQLTSRAVRGDAALSAQDKILDLLLDAGANLDRVGAVAIAAYGNQPALIRYLLSKGASPNAHFRSGPDDKTALIAAIEGISLAKSELQDLRDGSLSGPKESDIIEKEKGYRDCVTILLKAKVNVNEASRDTGETPFMAAIREGDFQIAGELLKRGAKRESVDLYGRTALLRVVTDNDLAGAKWLLQRKADLNRRDKEGFTALMLAVDAGDNAQWEQMKRLTNDPIGERPNPDGHPAMVALLLAHGVDKSVVANDGKTTALTLARRNKFSKVEKMLRAR